MEHQIKATIDELGVRVGASTQRRIRPGYRPHHAAEAYCTPLVCQRRKKILAYICSTSRLGARVKVGGVSGLTTFFSHVQRVQLEHEGSRSRAAPSFPDTFIARDSLVPQTFSSKSHAK